MRESHLQKLFCKAGKKTWDLVFADRPLTVIIATGVTCFAIYLQRRFGGQSSTQMNDAFMGVAYGLISYGVIFLLVFSAHFFYLTPKRLIEKAVAQRDAARSELEARHGVDTAKEKLSKHIKAMSDMWAEGKRVLENLLSPDRDLNLAKAEESDWWEKEASNWYWKVVQYLKANGESDDANYFEHCDDSADQIRDPFPSVLEKRNDLCRGIQQRVRNLRVIIERTKQPS